MASEATQLLSPKAVVLVLHAPQRQLTHHFTDRCRENGGQTPPPPPLMGEVVCQSGTTFAPTAVMMAGGGGAEDCFEGIETHVAYWAEGEDDGDGVGSLEYEGTTETAAEQAWKCATCRNGSPSTRQENSTASDDKPSTEKKREGGEEDYAGGYEEDEAPLLQEEAYGWHKPPLHRSRLGVPPHEGNPSGARPAVRADHLGMPSPSSSLPVLPLQGRGRGGGNAPCSTPPDESMSSISSNDSGDDDNTHTSDYLDLVADCNDIVAPTSSAEVGVWQQGDESGTSDRWNRTPPPLAPDAPSLPGPDRVSDAPTAPVDTHLQVCRRYPPLSSTSISLEFSATPETSYSMGATTPQKGPAEEEEEDNDGHHEPSGGKMKQRNLEDGPETPPGMPPPPLVEGSSTSSSSGGQRCSTSGGGDERTGARERETAAAGVHIVDANDPLLCAVGGGEGKQESIRGSDTGCRDHQYQHQHQHQHHSGSRRHDRHHLEGGRDSREEQQQQQLCHPEESASSTVCVSNSRSRSDGLLLLLLRRCGSPSLDLCAEAALMNENPETEETRRERRRRRRRREREDVCDGAGDVEEAERSSCHRSRRSRHRHRHRHGSEVRRSASSCHVGEEPYREAPPIGGGGGYGSGREEEEMDRGNHRPHRRRHRERRQRPDRATTTTMTRDGACGDGAEPKPQPQDGDDRQEPPPHRAPAWQEGSPPARGAGEGDSSAAIGGESERTEEAFENGCRCSPVEIKRHHYDEGGAGEPMPPCAPAPVHPSPRRTAEGSSQHPPYPAPPPHPLIPSSLHSPPASGGGVGAFPSPMKIRPEKIQGGGRMSNSTTHTSGWTSPLAPQQQQQHAVRPPSRLQPLRRSGVLLLPELSSTATGGSFSRASPRSDRGTATRMRDNASYLVCEERVAEVAITAPWKQRQPLRPCPE